MSRKKLYVCMVALGGGKSEVQMLNSVGERTPSCGTPVFN